MAQGYTIQEIQQEFLFLGSDIEALARQLERVLERGGERGRASASAATKSSRARWRKHARWPAS